MDAGQRLAEVAGEAISLWRTKCCPGCLAILAWQPLLHDERAAEYGSIVVGKDGGAENTGGAHQALRLNSVRNACQMLRSRSDPQCELARDGVDVPYFVAEGLGDGPDINDCPTARVDGVEGGHNLLRRQRRSHGVTMRVSPSDS